MMDISKGLWPGHTYNEEDWNPVTAEQAMENPGFGYSGRPQRHVPVLMVLTSPRNSEQDIC